MAKYILLNTERCSGCGACISHCNKRAIIMTNDNGEFNNLKKIKINMSLCNYCKKCIEVCRLDAIT
jgi:ferredoxin